MIGCRANHPPQPRLQPVHRLSPGGEGSAHGGGLELEGGFIKRPDLEACTASKGADGHAGSRIRQRYQRVTRKATTFPEVRKTWPMVLPVLRGAVDLGQRHDRDG